MGITETVQYEHIHRDPQEPVWHVTGCDTSGPKVNTDFSKSEQAQRELILGERVGGAWLGLQPLPAKTLEVFYHDRDLTSSSGLLAILITAW